MEKGYTFLNFLNWFEAVHWRKILSSKRIQQKLDIEVTLNIPFHRNKHFLIDLDCVHTMPTHLKTVKNVTLAKIEQAFKQYQKNVKTV